MRKLFGKRQAAPAGDAGAVDRTPGEEHEHGTSLATSLGLSRAQLAHALTTYGYVTFWIVTSAGAARRELKRTSPPHWRRCALTARLLPGVILYNKWILTVWGFHFPITLTMWHMAFCSVVAFVLVRECASPRLLPPPRCPLCAPTRASPVCGQVRTGAVADVAMTRHMFLTSVVPIGALFSGTLWFGNASYTYLSVSFIQMLKALMPAAVYFCSVMWARTPPHPRDPL